MIFEKRRKIMKKPDIFAAALRVAAALAIFAAAFPVSAANGQAGGSTEVTLMEHKLRYEREKTEYLQKDILDRVLGPDKAIVVVDVEFGLDTVTTRSFAKERKSEQKKDIGQIEYLLPGVPNPKAVSAGDPTGETKEESGQQEKTTVEVKVALKRQIVTVLHDDKVPAVRLETVKDAITSALRIDPRRGDRIDFKETKFTRGFLDQILKPLVLIPLILALLIIYFLFVPFAGFLRSYVKTLREKGGTEVTVDSKFENPEGEGEDGGGGGGGGGNLSAAELEALEEEKKKYRPFHYIDDENLKRLIYLIRKEPARNIALVISYLKPEHVKEILLSLNPETQSRVAIEMATIRQMTKEQVLKIDNDIKEKIDFLIGGIEHLLKVLDQVDNVTRDGILDYLQNEKPELYDRVRKFILKFDDIKGFSDQAMQVVLNNPDLKNSALLARALKDAPQDVVNKFFANMSTNAVQLVKEEMQYTQALNPNQIEEERKKILDVVRKLEDDGKIFVREKPKSSVLEGEEVLSDDSSGSEAASGPASEYYQAGVAAHDAGNFEDAISYLEYALSLDDKLTDAHNYLAAAYYALGRYDDALARYEIVLSMNPGDSELSSFVEQLRMQTSRR
jgi:flagellar motor switch protein FliG